jgi:hypothetical protein
VDEFLECNLAGSRRLGWVSENTSQQFGTGVPKALPLGLELGLYLSHVFGRI